jgi:hypothetical protein
MKNDFDIHQWQAKYLKETSTTYGHSDIRTGNLHHGDEAKRVQQRDELLSQAVNLIRQAGKFDPELTFKELLELTYELS